MLLNITVSASEDLSLPDPLTTSAGNRVTTPAEWQKTRRPEILELFRTHVYGRAPIGRPDTLRFDVKETNKNAMGGKATLKRIEIHFSGPGGKGMISLALFIPNKAPKPFSPDRRPSTAPLSDNLGRPSLLSSCYPLIWSGYTIMWVERP